MKLTLATGHSTILLLTDSDYTIKYACKVDESTASEIILSKDQDYVIENDENGAYGSSLEEHWPIELTLLSESQSIQWAKDTALDLGIVKIETEHHEDSQTVSISCSMQDREIATFRGCLDGHFYDGDIYIPYSTSSKFFRGIDIEDALLAFL